MQRVISDAVQTVSICVGVCDQVRNWFIWDKGLKKSSPLKDWFCLDYSMLKHVHQGKYTYEAHK